MVVLGVVLSIFMRVGHFILETRNYTRASLHKLQKRTHSIVKRVLYQLVIFNLVLFLKRTKCDK